MKLIIPLEITDAILTSSSLAEDDHLEWNVATTYGYGDYCISSTTHRIYRSLEVGNLANDPDAEYVVINDPTQDTPDPIYWQVISATNKWKAFDSKPTHLAEDTSDIIFDLLPGEMVGGIACFNVTADSVNVTVTDPTDGEVYNRDVDIIDDSVVFDWYSYFFESTLYLKEFVLTDLPLYLDATTTITITGVGGDTRSVGQISMGRVSEIGTTDTEGSGISGIDFSYINQDDYGNLETVQRVASRLSDFQVWVDLRRVQVLNSWFTQLRGGVPAVWVGDEDSRLAALNFGFLLDHRTDYQEGYKALVNLRIQGVV